MAYLTRIAVQRSSPSISRTSVVWILILDPREWIGLYVVCRSELLGRDDELD